MRDKIIAVVFLAVSLSIMGCTAERHTQFGGYYSQRQDTLRAMKMEDVIALSKAGVSDSLIIATMDATNSWFHLKSQDVIALKNAGVSEPVINAMLQQPSGSSNQSGNSSGAKYYVYPWYGGFYPYWYYPSFSVRFGYRSYHPLFFHHRRFR